MVIMIKIMVILIIKMREKIISKKRVRVMKQVAGKTVLTTGIVKETKIATGMIMLIRKAIMGKRIRKKRIRQIRIKTEVMITRMIVV